VASPPANGRSPDIRPQGALVSNKEEPSRRIDAQASWRGTCASLWFLRVLMRRIVIDTNVFVAAGFNPRSAAARLLAAVREGRLQMIWNEPTRRETEMILRQIPHLDWESVADLFKPETEFLGPVDPESFVFVPDPEDRKFAALSVAAQAHIVTNDNHLLSHNNSIGIDVLTPRAFLAREGEDT